MSEVLIEVKNLRKYFPVRGGILKRKVGSIKAVDGVSFNIKRGETFGVVGESGCGKTTLGRCLLRLIEPTEGEIYFKTPEIYRNSINGKKPDSQGCINLMSIKPKDLCKMRRYMQIVFQDPMSSLNPRMLVKDIVGEPLVINKVLKGPELIDKVSSLLEKVGLSRDHLFRFPHEFSGGQRQRICIARALALNPEFVVLDEPTSNLDVSVQAQVLNLLKKLQKEMGLTYLFISHNLGVIRHMADRVAVMYLGKFVEISDCETIFKFPLHPYTKALLSAIPSHDLKVKREHIRLKGEVPNPLNPPLGCNFHPRCPQALKVCGWEGRDLQNYIKTELPAEEEQLLLNKIYLMKPSNFELHIFLKDDKYREDVVSFMENIISEGRRRGEPIFEAISGIETSKKKINRWRKMTAITVSFIKSKEPVLTEVKREHFVACHLYGSSK